MSSPLRILLIAYSVPPSADVGGNRVARFCKYLPEFGVEPVILTVHTRFHKKLDHTFSLPDSIRVIPTTQYSTPLDWYARLKSRRVSIDFGKMDSTPKEQKGNAGIARRLHQKLLTMFFFPNHNWAWYFPARQAGRQLIQNAKFDAILSTAPPYTTHLIGLSLKKKFRIPWIADFRDPWVNNELLSASLPRWRRELDARLEANCVRSADLVVCNTDWLKRAMIERYRKFPEEKFVTLTNGFDDVKCPPHLELNKHNPLVCLHLGGIYGVRRIDTFCAGLSLLVKNQKLNPRAIKILFVGHTDDSLVTACRKVAGELIDSGMIEFHQHVDKEEAARLLWQADLLLVFPGNRTQIPFKFYEYLSTGKPIFAVSQPGALSDVIAQTGAGIWTADGDPREIGEKFLLAQTLPVQPPEAIQRRWADRFHFRSLSWQLAKWIRELVEGQSAGQKKPSPTP